MRTYKIHLIRHGITEANVMGTCNGRRTNQPLCEEGYQKLDELLAKYRYPDIDALYSSPLTRCLQTAQVLYPGRDINMVDELCEYDFGDFEGRTGKELSSDPAYRKWTADPMGCPPPGGEDINFFLARITKGLETVFSDMMEKRLENVAVLTHGVVIMTLMGAYAFPRRGAFEWSLGNGMGYTLLMSTQMWMRDRAFELREILPLGSTDAGTEEENRRYGNIAEDGAFEV